MSMKPGLYWWVRLIDETGMSGTGPVGQVSVFDDQSAVFRWIKARNGAGVESFAVYSSIDDLRKVHGHGKPENFTLVPALSIGSGARIWSMENWGCCGSVIEIDMGRADSFYKIQPHDGGQPEAFWAWNWEVERDAAVIFARANKTAEVGA